MRYLPYLILIVCCASLAFTLSQDPPADEAQAILRARAEQPAEQASPTGTRTSNLLFSFDAVDNAACVRAIPDVNGDGLQDILVGIDESGTDNLFCLDGASTGTAAVLWSIQTTDGLSGGGFYGDDCLNPSSDVDSNSYGNVLAGTVWGGRTAYNFDCQAGTDIWKLDTYTLTNSGWIYSLAECGDVNNDGVPDAVFGAGSYCDTLFMIDGASTGGAPNILWQLPTSDAVLCVRCLGDANGDGKDDVIAAVGDSGYELLCRSGTNGGFIWTFPTSGASCYACGVLPDITGDGINEALAVLWISNGSAIRCINGATGTQLWASTAVDSYGMAANVLEDVTGDGYHEIIVSSWDNAVTVLSGADGSLVWETETDSLNGGDVWTARAIDDLNGDGRQDVIAGSFDYDVYALDGDSGEIFWQFYTNNRVFSVYPVDDLNGDGRPEVAAGTQDTTNNTLVYVIEGDGGIPWPGLTLLGTGALGEYFGIEVIGDAGDFVLTLFNWAQGYLYVPPYGYLEVGMPFFALPVYKIPASGPLVLGALLPNDPGLLGQAYFQALVAKAPGNGAFTDMEEIRFH